ncbi:hypothetical protein AAC387_Pa01g2802 [Persea americana]
MLQKDSFHWSPKAETAFENLKRALTTTPVLALPNFSQEFVLECDASGSGIGAVLMQNGHPLAYLMQNGHPLAYLSGRNLTLSICDKEMLAIIFAVSKWRPYLLGRHFKILTDHRTLKYFVEQRLTTMEQPKWLTKLIGYDYEIIYRSGKENTVADAISCLGEYAALFMVSQTIFSFIPDIIATYSQDPNLGSIRDRLRVDPLGVPHYSLDNDMLRYKGRIVVPTNSEWCSKNFSHFHASPFGGHSGFLATYKRVSTNFYWKGLKQAICKFVAECDTCQHSKYETIVPPGLLQPLPIPSEIWADLSMDFTDDLPSSARKTSIMVVVDRFSKYAHFSTLAHPYTTSTVADVFIRDVAKLHGMQHSIVSDRDRIFISQFWEAFFERQGTQLCRSTAYHPQSDGQIEVVNQSVEQYLRCFASHRTASLDSMASLGRILV